MRLQRYMLFFYLLGNGLYSQTTNLKSTYDSIIALKSSKQESLILHFFYTNSDHPDQLQLALYYHEYSKKTYRKDIDKAIKFVTDAIDIRSKHLDTSAVSKSLYALGYYYDLKGSYTKSIQTYKSIIEIDNENTLTAKAHNRLGVVYSYIGDFDKALMNFLKAQQFFVNHNKNVLLLKNHIDLSLMISKKNLSNNDRIEYHLRKADSLAKLTTTNYLNQLIINQVFGSLYDERQQYLKAIDYYSKAIEISQLMQDSAYIAMNYNNIGVSYKKYNNHKNAFYYYNKAMDYVKNKPQIKAPIYNNLGDYYITKKHYKKALSNYQKAITSTLESTHSLIHTSLPNIEDLKVSPYKLDLLGYLTDKANAWITYYTYSSEKKHLQYALETFTIADQLIDVIRFESTEFQSKLFWREQSASLYMRAVHVCHELKQPKEAFYFIEKNKAILLLEDLTHEQAKENAKLPETLSEKEFELKRRIRLAEENLNQHKQLNRFLADSLRDIVYKQKESYERYIDSLETGYPLYYQYKQKLPIKSFDDLIKEQKSNDQITLHYILNDQEGYGMLLSQANQRFFKIDKVPELQKNIKTFKQKLVSPLYTQEEYQTYLTLSNTIYKALFPQITPTDLLDKNITIIPDHTLQQLPFETLIPDPSANKEYLLTLCTINYAYSLSFLKLNKKTIRRPRKDFIGFAPIHYVDTTLTSLSRSTSEVRQIASLFSGDIYEKEHASKANFISSVPDYKIIHLSTHADIGKNSTPWVAFYDDKLNLNELYTSKNQAELVVLSACNTSVGELKVGEGVMSLARGFFSTGTGSVVSTLWSVNEKSTNEILTSFYKNLKKGSSKTEALQKAKRTYLKNHQGVEASPYYWGAPILIGDTNPITMRASSTSNFLLVILGLVSICGIFFIAYRHSKKQKK